MNSKYLRKENEEDLDYAMRLIDIKKEERPDDLDWADIVDLLGLDLNKDSLRKSQDTIFGGIAVYKKMKNDKVKQEPIEYQKEIEVQLHELKKERMKLIQILKHFEITISGFRPIEEAIITSGGISTKEINPKTMESKLISGLFFAGEVIDVDAYTGGFNLQIAWSTGYTAGIAERNESNNENYYE